MIIRSHFSYILINCLSYRRSKALYFFRSCLEKKEFYLVTLKYNTYFCWKVILEARSSYFRLKVLVIIIKKVYL